MDDSLNRRSSGESPRLPLQPEGRSGDRESHQMTLPRAPTDDPWRSESVSYSSEYHLTVRTKAELTRRQASLLLDVLNYQVAHFGCSFVMYVAWQDLYFRVLGNKRRAREVNDEHIRLTLTVTEVLLSDLNKQSDLFLGIGDRYYVSQRLVEEIVKVRGLMSKRTYQSRHNCWRPEQMLLVRTVPVDIHFLERNATSEPYSSYCKGYGESHPSAHRVRTRPSFELDGDETSPEQLEAERLFKVCTQLSHVISSYIEIWIEVHQGQA